MGETKTPYYLCNHLNNSTGRQELMCAALLRTVSSYSDVRTGRPMGGPDGGHDLEAIYQGSTLVWGAVGFRNGGGCDKTARKSAEKKFKEDLDRALEENPSLPGFVFFTNVDLTPTRIESLKKLAQVKNVNHCDIFDFQRLRLILDRDEGLIVRVQYLDLPMDSTEQASLFGKFGDQLQGVITSRLDRVEQTLAEMERFLAFQRPLSRIDTYVYLNQPTTSAELGDEAILVICYGLQRIDDEYVFLIVNDSAHPKSKDALYSRTYGWGKDRHDAFSDHRLSKSSHQSILTSYTEFNLFHSGRLVRVSDLSVLSFAAYCTENLRDKIKYIATDLNGYEFLGSESNGMDGSLPEIWHDKVETLPGHFTTRKWVPLVKLLKHRIDFDPPKMTRPFSRLVLGP